jgi:hypothetical protein
MGMAKDLPVNGENGRTDVKPKLKLMPKPQFHHEKKTVLPIGCNGFSLFGSGGGLPFSPCRKFPIGSK